MVLTHRLQFKLYSLVVLVVLLIFGVKFINATAIDLIEQGAKVSETLGCTQEIYTCYAPSGQAHGLMKKELSKEAQFRADAEYYLQKKIYDFKSVTTYFTTKNLPSCKMVDDECQLTLMEN